MNIKRIRSLGRLPELREAGIHRVSQEVPPYPGHVHFWKRALSRRTFFTGAAGVASLAIASSGLSLPVLSADEDDERDRKKSGSPSPNPIPGGFAGPGGEIFHVSGDTPGDEPSTIFDFNGTFGLAMLNGTGTGTNDKGESCRLPFEADMRFMTGKYIGQDGARHRGTFALVWLDLFQGSLDGPQIHDFNYGIASSGLFWTALIPSDGVDVELEKGEAQLCLSDSFLIDAFSIDNALARGLVSPASVSFKVHWHHPNTRPRVVRDSTNRFELEFVQISSAIEWSAVEKGFKYTSDPADTSVTELAELGRERNGAFFGQGD